MNFDFASIMLIATVITGIIWALDVKLWKPQRLLAAKELEDTYQGVDKEMVIQEAYKESVWVEYARSFFPIILFVLILRSFIVEPFRIPSGSMIPTLKVGDFILVNKFAYGVRLPVIETKILGVGEPSRGDVAVFRFPKEPSIDYIKRVVGLPGDKIAYRDKNLFVNGKRIAVSNIGPYVETKNGTPIPGATRLSEKLFDDTGHEILIEARKPSFNGEWLVPAGQYFVMGDNRDNSNDSRFWGYVPEENLVGKAFMIWMNFNLDDGGVEWSRIGNSIE